MNLISRFITRIRFRKTLNADQSRNVVDGMVKARRLYKELSIKTHPDRNPDNRELAERLMQEVVANRHNYEELLRLKEEIEENLM